MSWSHRQAAMVIWAMGPAFLAVGAWLFFASPKAEIPRGEVHLVPLDQVKPGPWRNPLADAGKATVGGTAHACSECHKLFTPSPVENRVLMQHKEIVMNHGMNTRCLNCHYGADRDKLVLHDGTLVNFDEAPRLCSQCHGTVYRDWQRGIHGKTMGSWDVTTGNQHRLRCNECHDPHAPAYKPLVPLPGPSTMRMGDQTRDHAEEHKHTPLRQWSRPERAAPGESGHGTPDEHEKQEKKEGGS